MLRRRAGCVKWLLALGAVVPLGCLTFLLVRSIATDVLFDACYMDDAGRARLALRFGAYVDATSESGRTPLECALANRWNEDRVLDTVAVLLAAGTEVNQRGSDGQRPMRMTYDPKILRLLKRYGARY